MIPKTAKTMIPNHDLKIGLPLESMNFSWQVPVILAVSAGRE